VFDYISGRLRRGPRWMTDNGLEWLARLVIEPGRLWRRYVLGNPAFLASVLLQLATSRPQPVTMREAA
jgi:N-acetylglucosaminyldiphosphoundecaprenol N-acetyl-beta-D-mannosaminyltransferase